MDEGNGESSSSQGKKRKPRGPTLCTKLKEQIKNQRKDLRIEFDENGSYVGDNAGNFASYLGAEVRLHVNINIKSWDVVNDGLKNMIWEDIKVCKIILSTYLWFILQPLFVLLIKITYNRCTGNWRMINLKNQFWKLLEKVGGISR